jgi:GT2 family glycosyltransferase
MKQNLVSIIIVNFNGAQFIEKLFSSIEAQTYTNFEVIVVDNCSSDKSKILINKFIKKTKTTIRLIELQKNFGYAKGNNIAIDSSNGDFLLFLNTDAFMDKNALKEMMISINSNENIAGVNPKVYLNKFKPEKIIDNIGICVDYSCSPYNRGIGQIDLGQYDFVKEIMGLCFACCLVKKDIYIKVGELDSSYFAYFEDVDWCIRARKNGYLFFSSPKAVVYHVHSATTSANSYAWKYFLIFRNYLRTVTKSMGIKTTINIIPRKLIDLLIMSLRRDTDTYIKKSIFKIILSYIFFDFWKYFLKRKKTQKNYVKKITDKDIFYYSKNEPSNFFDSVNYKPIIGIKMNDYIVKKLIKNHEKLSQKWITLKKKYFSSFYNKEKWNVEFDEFIKEIHNSQKK